MRATIDRRFAGLVTAAAFTLALAAPAQAERTVYRGQILCEDRGVVMPLQGVEVALFSTGADPFPNHHRDDVTQTNEVDGTFELTAIEQEGRHHISVTLRDTRNIRLKTWMGINDWSKSFEVPRNNRPNRNVGAYLYQQPGLSHPCSIWLGAHKANREFEAMTGRRLPAGGLLIQNDAIGAGVPWTAHVEIYWGENANAGWNNGSDNTVRHEFGHVIRHGDDGDATHFFGDIVHHNYGRHHGQCAKTGLGFAFNEGWADYWARRNLTRPNNCDPAVTPDDYEVEGNVSAELNDLADRCFGGQMAPMVEVLRTNRGEIHSLEEFRARVPAGCRYRTVAATTVAASAEPAPRSLPALAASARRHIRGLNRDLRGLKVDLRSAVKRSRRLPSCRRAKCGRALERRLAPAQVRTEIALTRLVRRSFYLQNSTKEQKALRALSPIGAVNRLRRLRKAYLRSAARTSITGIKRALRAGRPLFRKDRSKATKALRARLLRQLRSLRRAQKKGRGTGGMTFEQLIAPGVKRVPVRTYEPPAPAPTPSRRRALRQTPHPPPRRPPTRASSRR